MKKPPNEGPKRLVAAKGPRVTIVWAQDHSGRSPAREFFASVDRNDQRRLFTYFRRLAELGRIHNQQQFKALGTENPSLFEFKSRDVRLLGAFSPRKEFVISWGVKKKRDRHRATDLEKATRLFLEDELRWSSEDGSKN